MGGRKVRADAHVLLAGIASFPRALQIEEPDTYEKWERTTVEWLQKKYGNNLRAVLKHDDEEHPHMHFYVYSDTQVNAKDLHDGYKAAEALPSMTKEAGIAYANAMRDMQSAYYADVAHECGLLRDGPKRRRETRDTYKARQREERERVALSKNVIESQSDLLNKLCIAEKETKKMLSKAELENKANIIFRGDLDFDRQEIRCARESIAEERENLDKQLQRVQRDRAVIENDWAKAREARASASQIDAEFSRKLVLLEKQSEIIERSRVASEKIKEDLKLEKARAEAITKKADEKLKAIGAIEDVATIVRKPELLAMLTFIEQNPGARKVLDLMKADPEMSIAITEAIDAWVGLSNGQSPKWNSPQASAAEDYLASLNQSKRNSGDTHSSASH